MTERVEEIRIAIRQRGLSMHWEDSGVDWLLTALAQAEREREEYKGAAEKFARQADTLQAAFSEVRAEVERLKGRLQEHKDEIASRNESILFLRAEVERLKGLERLVTDITIPKLEADLASVRAALDDALSTLETCDAPEYANEGDLVAWIERREASITVARAALEGRG